MGFIEHHTGCAPDAVGCFGPRESFYTLFGTELRFLFPHLFAAVIFGLVILSILFVLRKKSIINIPLYLVYLIPVAAIIVLFFLFALLFRIIVFY